MFVSAAAPAHCPTGAHLAFHPLSPARSTDAHFPLCPLSPWCPSYCYTGGTANITATLSHAERSLHASRLRDGGRLGAPGVVSARAHPRVGRARPASGQNATSSTRLRPGAPP